MYRKTPCTREVWDYLTREANHTEAKSSGRVFKRGELLRTYEQIKHDLRWYEGCCEKAYTYEQIRGAIRWLKSEGMITAHKTTRGYIIAVCNYDYYQAGNNYTDTASQTARSPYRSPRKKTIETQARKGVEEAETPSQTTPQPVRSPQTPHTINKNLNNEIINTGNVYSDEQREGFKKFQEWIVNNAPSVAQMKEPFTIGEFLKIKKLLPDHDAIRIRNILTDMDLWEPLLAKRINAYKAFLTFHRRTEKQQKTLYQNFNY